MASQEKVLLEASFENATKYFVVAAAVPLTLIVVTIPLLPIVLPLIWIAKTIEYKRIRCLLLERSLKVHRGWLNREEKTIPLDKITDLGIKQGPIMRKIGVEAIAVETAGQSSQGSALVSLVGIQDARGFRDAVLKQKERLQAGEIAPAHAPPAEADEPVLDEIKDAVLRIERLLERRER